jgi:hypothetical protein
VVVVVNGNQIAQLQVACGARSFAGNALHGATITEEDVGVVVEEVEAGLVEHGSRVGLGDGQTDGIGEPLAQRTGGDLNARGIVRFGVARGDAVHLLRGAG